MSIFKNKQEFEERFEVYNLLTLLEKAHKEQDDLKSSILLTKLKKDHNITIKACADTETVVQ